MEASKRMKASEVGDWLRQIAGKRDHREVLSDEDYLVLRPGPNFDWLMSNPAAGQPLPLAPERDPVSDDRIRSDAVGESRKLRGSLFSAAQNGTLVRGYPLRLQPNLRTKAGLIGLRPSMNALSDLSG